MPIITYVGREGHDRLCPFRSGYDHKLRTCRCRGCPRCGVPWARDQWRNMKVNLEATGGPVVLLTITAPGEERLPWDEHYCRAELKRGPRHRKHRGPSGCRVQQRAAREWSDTLTWRWSKLRAAAQEATKTAVGMRATIHERAYEPQKRGVPHLHLVLGYATPREIAAAHFFAAQLKQRAASYDFGYVDAKWDRNALHGVRLKPTSAQDAARYLSSYLTGRNSKSKSSIRENVHHAVMPQSLVWLSPKLSRKTLVTMRMLRRARHLYAAAKGFCDPPKWRDMLDAATTGLVYRRAFVRQRSSGLDPPERETPGEKILALAEHIDREYRRAFRERQGYGIWFDQLPDVTAFAYGVAGLERQAMAA